MSDSPKRSIEELLENWLDSTAIWIDGKVYKTKASVGQVNDLKISVWPGDHDPPHFHVTSTQRNINATFHLYTFELRTDVGNRIKQSDVKKIQAFFEMPVMRKKLEEKFVQMQQQ